MHWDHFLERNRPMAPIKDDADLDRAIKTVEFLLLVKDRDPQTQAYLDFQASMIEIYESDLDFGSLPEYLQHLLDTRETLPEIVTSITGVVMSGLLKGEPLRDGEADVLAEYFHVKKDSFLGF